METKAIIKIKRTLPAARPTAYYQNQNQDEKASYDCAAEPLPKEKKPY